MSTLAAAHEQRSRYLRGAVFVLAAGLLWSTTGTIMRFAPQLDAWQFLFFRCIGILAAMNLYGYWQGRGPTLRRILALGPAGAVMTLSWTIAGAGFIFAIKTTTVANALFFNSCAPLLAAILGAVLLKEKLSSWSVAMIGLGLGGLAVMVAGELEAGKLVGNIAALTSALGFAVTTICLRWAPSRDFTPAIVSYAALTAAICAIITLAAGKSLLVPPFEALAGFCSGFLFMGLGFALFVRGGPEIPAAGQSVLAQSETVFGPIWVWLLFAEVPLPTTLLGGAIVLAAVIGMALAGVGRTTLPAAR
ncbi:MAG: DMT family transporter [Methylobacteriaceae bacterium]|nr:DMT family transporter [Methylobacteriaceae bacterium]MBV9702188.1 DMT family transporter [Methylobacteriaceae bacterium]